MLHSVRGVFDGKRLELKEKVSVKGKTVNITQRLVVDSSVAISR